MKLKNGMEIYKVGGGGYTPGITNLSWGNGNKLAMRVGWDMYTVTKGIDLVKKAFIDIRNKDNDQYKLYRDDTLELAQFLEKWLERYTQGYFSNIGGAKLHCYDAMYLDRTVDKDDFKERTKLRLNIHIDDELLFDIGFRNLDKEEEMWIKDVPTYTLKILINLFTSFALTAPLFCGTYYNKSLFYCSGEELEEDRPFY